jgi:antitoxin component HigA of HigAB toxin-antitoxin module
MVAIERNKPFIGCIAGRDFFPGVNVLTDEDYAVIREHRTFKEELACGNLSIMQEVKAEIPVKAIDPAAVAQTAAEKTAQSIASLSVTTAKGMIAKILERKTLETIKALDGRKGIQDACEAQIKMLLDRE